MEIADLVTWLVNYIVYPALGGVGWALWKLHRAISELRGHTDKREVQVVAELKALEVMQAQMQSNHNNELGRFAGLLSDVRDELHEMRSEIKQVGEKIYELLLQERKR